MTDYSIQKCKQPLLKKKEKKKKPAWPFVYFISNKNKHFLVYRDVHKPCENQLKRFKSGVSYSYYYVLYIISFSFCMALVILKSKKIKFNDELFGSITLIKCRYLFFHDFLSSYCPQQFRLRSSSFFSLLQSKDKPLVHHNLEPHIYGLRCSSSSWQKYFMTFVKRSK